MTKFLNISTDTTLGGSSASDSTVSSQKAIKAYVDSQTGTAPAFANITGQPTDNTNLATALNEKQDKLTAGDNILIENSLPSGYTQLEYIESSGSKSIDTGVIPTNSTGIYIKVDDTELSQQTEAGYFVGSQTQSKYMGYFTRHPSTDLVSVWCWNGESPIGNNIQTNGSEILINYLNDRKYVYKGSSVYTVSSNLPTLDTGVVSLVLFAINMRGGSSSYFGKGKIYFAKITNGTTLVRDFIPAKRNSDNVIGLYDRVTNTFYTERNSNSFTGGAEINTTKTISAIVPTKVSELTNDSGFITGITSSDVTTALGYTPYDSSNPSGYTSNTGTVTSVNNVSPVNGNVSLSIPTVNNATLTITQGGTTKGTFTANASSDVTIDLDAGGSSRNIGEIIQSTIPLTDAGLHLLDGSLISGSGSYSAFVTYVAGLVSSYPDLFETEANWQTSVTNYGVCGKFVYNSQNNTVRLPKITGFTEGTIDQTVLGDLVEAGLPNITGGMNSSGSVEWLTANVYGFGAFTRTGGTSSNATGSGSGTRANQGFDFDASRSSSIYGNSNTVQPQSVKVLYYIVIATATKTSIEVDIDEIATDLNGKADKDLSNCTSPIVSAPYIVQAYSNGTTNYKIWSNGWCEQSFHITTPSTINTTVALPVAFKDTNYTIILSTNDYGDLYPVGSAAFPATNSTFYALAAYGGTGYAQRCCCYACGYIS